MRSEKCACVRGVGPSLVQNVLGAERTRQISATTRGPRDVVAAAQHALSGSGE